MTRLAALLECALVRILMARGTGGEVDAGIARLVAGSGGVALGTGGGEVLPGQRKARL